MAQKRTPLSPEDTAEIVRLYVDLGWSLSRIAHRFNRQHGNIRYLLVKNNVDLRRQGRPEETLTLTNDQVVIAEFAYLSLKWSLPRIASTLHCHGPQVRKALLAQGIKMRSHQGGKRSDEEAIRMVNDAIRRGDLKRGPCEECKALPFIKGKTNTIAHHDDYNFPLVVRWLCHRCHRLWHQENEAIMKGESREPSHTPED